MIDRDVFNAAVVLLLASAHLAAKPGGGPAGAEPRPLTAAAEQKRADADPAGSKEPAAAGTAEPQEPVVPSDVQPPETTDETPDSAEAEAETAAPPLQFFNLRYDEDYRYLEEFPEARGGDPWMRLKHMDLGHGWHMDFGGEFRLRYENRENPLFGRDRRTADAQQNYRWMLHANVYRGQLFRLFVQGIHAHVEDQDGPFEPTQENHADLHQLFFDFRPLGERVPLTLRLGRQELDYGHDRLIGAFEWVSTRRRFDAAKIFYRSDHWDIDLFAARPVVVERTGGDDWNNEYNFFGVYNTVRWIEGHGVDFYALHSDRADHVLNPNGHIGGRSFTTVGGRVWGQQGGWDYDAEFASQFGQWASDSLQAWFTEVDVGYKFDHPWYPRLGTGIGWASGDGDPRDRHVGTWDQLFTYDHVCINMQDLVGRQNVRRWYLMFEAWPTYKIKASAFYHLYWLDEEADFYYNSGAAPVFRDSFGHSGDRLGQALEFMLEYQLTPHTSLMAVYSHMWDGSYFHDAVGDTDEPNFFFIQYQYRF